ncbi:eCIS core domain-containing protein [Natrialba chahannaoensis]|uniref:eCIS core domain-containing protein n=1 Tax=Natrialba chahannaoensis TaxID=68911 RepID=UPI000A05428A
MFGQEYHIQRALDGTDTTQDEVPGQVLDVLGSGGRPLERSIQRTMEDRMGADFSDVRIHTGGKAAEAAEAIDARAFTCGNDIVFNAGEYDPESAEGQFLLAHELAHVTQQNGGAPISMMPKPDADLQIDPDPHLEREADQAAEEALSGEEPLVVNRMGTDVHIQRIPKGKVFEALAMFEEERGEDHSDVREKTNELQLQNLHSTATDILEQEDVAESASLSRRELIGKGEDGFSALLEGATQQGKIQHRVAELEAQIEDKLEDVALTDDQRKKLWGAADTSTWDKVQWQLISTLLLNVTEIPALLEATKNSARSEYGVDERGEQLLAHAKQGKIESWEDVKEIWYQTNGDFAERAKKIKEEIRKGTFLDEDNRPDHVNEREE